jgi:hypothetical protein
MDRFSAHFRTMIKAFTVSQAKPQLGRLLDQAGDGRAVFLRRKERLYRIDLVAEVEPIPQRPFGFFSIDSDDPLVALANAAPPSFSPPR